MPSTEDIITVDIKSELSPAILLAVMHCADIKSRNHALVTLGAGLFDFYANLRNLANESRNKEISINHARWRDITGSQFTPNAAGGETIFSADELDGSIKSVENELIIPFGGLRSLIDAPGPANLDLMFNRAKDHGAIAAGLMLLTVARLADIDANRWPG